MYVSRLFMEKLCVSDYFSNVQYQDLSAIINPSKIKDLEKTNYLNQIQNNVVVESQGQNFTFIQTQRQMVHQKFRH